MPVVKVGDSRKVIGLLRRSDVQAVYDREILVSELKDNTFYAVISLSIGDSTLTVDSRPSDAIAIALRAKAPIFVNEAVIESAKSLDIPESVKEKSGSARGQDGFFTRLSLEMTPIKPRDIILFTKQFKTLIQAGVSMIQILQIMEAQTENKRLQKIITQISEDIKEISFKAIILIYVSAYYVT